MLERFDYIKLPDEYRNLMEHVEKLFTVNEALMQEAKCRNIL